MKEIEQIASKHLGKAGDGTVVKPYETPDFVDTDLLVAIPRYLNRTQYDLSGDEFVGFDTWHGYEVSFLTHSGYPVNCVAKIRYSSDSEYIVESKSIKLYLNSFNMMKVADTPEAALRLARDRIEKDLSSTLETQVSVYLHDTRKDIWKVPPVNFHEYSLLDDEVDLDNTEFSDYNENPDILLVSETDYDEELSVWTPSLRSNCRVTNQPDWGDVFIYMTGSQLPDETSLLKYIVSMRSENHFHEEICECLYKRLLDRFSPDELFVTCLYTRRGGIDINPVRANKDYLLSKANGLYDVMQLSDKTVRQ